MDWKTYRKIFDTKAKNSGLDNRNINKCLQYAKKLFFNNVPVIYDEVNLSLLVGYNTSYLLAASNSPKHFYRTYKIPKKNQGYRTISEPLPSLMEIQKWILRNILDKCQVSAFAKAYVKRLSIKDNARFHIKQPKVLTVDISNFFGSIKYIKVYSFFRNLGYSKGVSTLLGNLCCYHKSLPQGAPTSSALSNLVTLKLDKRIANFVLRKGIRYTRYADDLTFSGNFEPGMLLKFLRVVISDEGFNINNKKVRVMHRNQRQEVTGIVVNEKMQTPREERRLLRQRVYYIKKYGLSDHLRRTNDQKPHIIEHLLGKANFIKFINKNDKDIINCIAELKKYKND